MPVALPWWRLWSTIPHLPSSCWWVNPYWRGTHGGMPWHHTSWNPPANIRKHCSKKRISIWLHVYLQQLTIVQVHWGHAHITYLLITISASYRIFLYKSSLVFQTLSQSLITSSTRSPNVVRSAPSQSCSWLAISWMRTACSWARFISLICWATSVMEANAWVTVMWPSEEVGNWFNIFWRTERGEKRSMVLCNMQYWALFVHNRWND